MSRNYRTHLLDKQAHRLSTALWQVANAPTPQAPRRDVIYRTRDDTRMAYSFTHRTRPGMGRIHWVRIGSPSYERVQCWLGGSR